MYQMVCPVLEGFQAMEGLDASDGAGTKSSMRRTLWLYWSGPLGADSFRRLI